MAMPDSFLLGDQIFYLNPSCNLKKVRAVAKSSGAEAFPAIEAAVISMINPRGNSHARFKKVADDPNNPITFDDLVEIFTWMIGTYNQR